MTEIAANSDDQKRSRRPLVQGRFRGGWLPPDAIIDTGQTDQKVKMLRLDGIQISADSGSACRISTQIATSSAFGSASNTIWPTCAQTAGMGINLPAQQRLRDTPWTRLVNGKKQTECRFGGYGCVGTNRQRAGFNEGPVGRKLTNRPKDTPAWAESCTQTDGIWAFDEKGTQPNRLDQASSH
ncbi:unnamed protein product [Protopolystoma xenopodis]|uniref:Uncharacterized protein n=1 Tax=Protopolystoma xenopodis TaxID=117903 RepID=A0A3S5FEE6_9PLAT|nr:unnamed protein product [Protopolystoma xenopodis]